MQVAAVTWSSTPTGSERASSPKRQAVWSDWYLAGNRLKCTGLFEYSAAGAKMVNALYVEPMVPLVPNMGHQSTSRHWQGLSQHVMTHGDAPVGYVHGILHSLTDAQWLAAAYQEQLSQMQHGAGGC